MSIPIFLRPRNHVVRHAKKSGSAAGRHKPTERKKERNGIDNYNDMVLAWNQHVRKARSDE
jgi:hypothetical protein